MRRRRRRGKEKMKILRRRTVMQGKNECKGEEDYGQRGKERDDDNEAEVEGKVTRVLRAAFPLIQLAVGNSRTAVERNFGTHIEHIQVRKIY
jgi:hypothetical protein